MTADPATSLDRRYAFLPPPRGAPTPAVVKPKIGPFQFPGPSDRVTINGMSGSGKTTFALYLFAESADFDEKPWIIIDFKAEDFNPLISEKIAQVIKIDATLPDEPGIYLIQPDPQEPEKTEDFLWRVYRKGHIGLFVDEAANIPEVRGERNSGGPFQSIITQGRSKIIPLYTIIQRPVNVNNSVFTENNFYCAFTLRGPEDLKKVRAHIPVHSKGYDVVWRDDLILKPHQCRWYDQRRNENFILNPVPDKALDLLRARVKDRPL